VYLQAKAEIVFEEKSNGHKFVTLRHYLKNIINVCVLHCSDLEGEVEQHITIMPNPAARRGSIANYAFPELHPKVNRKYEYAFFSFSFQTKHLHFTVCIPFTGKRFFCHFHSKLSFSN
jgi:hypothetical protein